MLNVHEEFLNAIKGSKNINEVEKKVEESAFELSKKKLSRLKDIKKREQRATELLKSYIMVLKDEGIENISTIKSVIEGVTKAISYEKEQEIYELITLISKIEKEMEEKKQDLRSQIVSLYDKMQKDIQVADDTTIDYFEKALSDIKLKEVSLLGILRETTEEAILTVLENQKDIEELINQITQNIVYQAIDEDDFDKERLMDISKTVLEVAVNIADEYQAVAKEILRGTTYGIKNGITKVINRFNESLEFLPDEIRDTKQEKILFDGLNIIDINNEYLNILRNCSQKSNGISKDILNEIINDIDFSLGKIVKITTQTKENILKKIEGLKYSPKINELKKRLSTLNLEKKIKNIKKDDFGTVANESKKLGIRAWEVAKNALKHTKENLKHNEKDK